MIGVRALVVIIAVIFAALAALAVPSRVSWLALSLGFFEASFLL